MFTDPQVASVGMTSGDQVVTAVHRIEGGRLSRYERPKRPGLLELAGTKEKVIVGAVAVGPEAGEWIGQLTLAVRARIPLEILLDTIQPYPTLSEVIFSGPPGAGRAALGIRESRSSRNCARAPA